MWSYKKSALTFILIALNVGIYVYTSIAGGNFVETNNDLIYKYGQVNGYVIYYGYYYQLITSMFIHVSIAHLVGNMLFLLIFGLRAEEFFSSGEYLAIYFLSGLAGNLLSLLFGPSSVSAGASGAIFGVFGAVAIYVRRSVGQSIMGALMYAFLLFVLNSGAGVNYLAHFGGLAVGLLMGYLLAVNHRARARNTFRYSYSTIT